MLNSLRLLLLLLVLSSCQSYMAKILPDRPSKEFHDAMAEGSPEFAQGWKDGCESGMSAGSNNFYKMFYRINKVDGFKMTSSNDYGTAWSNAFWYCVRYDYIKTKSSIWGSTFGGYK